MNYNPSKNPRTMTRKNGNNFLKFTFILLLESSFYLEINGDKSLPELFKMTTPDKIREEGYQVEEHTVITEDGYILLIHRIPGKSKEPAVLIEHGLLSNSFDFVVMGKNKSLAFILADHGYDVWLGNSRGNTYSRKHVQLDPSNPSYWNFSFHEMAIYDLPAVITYMSDMKNDSIFYIGHSMGTTMSYIMAIERPDIAAKVKLIISLAPSAFLTHSRIPFRILSPYAVEDLFKRLQIYELLPQSFLSRTITKYCNSLEGDICGQLLAFTSGVNYVQLNLPLVPMVLSHILAGASTKSVIHYLQIAASGKFQRYDYRPIGNEIMYNRSEPTEYDITKINVPIALFWADNDRIINSKDVQTLYDLIPKKALKYRVPDPLFTHTDFIWANNAPKLVYSKILSIIQEYIYL